MNWSWLGWGFIGLSAILLILFTYLFKLKQGYQIRRMPAVTALLASRASTIEQGKRRQIVLGQQLWSRTYPGLGLQSLAALSAYLNPESMADGRLTISGGDGSLVVFARQIIHGCYQDGFSTDLNNAPVVDIALPGPTPLSFTAGLLSKISISPHHSLALFGQYGPEAMLWTESAADDGGEVFAAAGSLASQAALFLTVRNLLIGEEIMMAPGLFEPSTNSGASWAAEDLLRFLLILLLITGAILKMVGIL